jgi:hypothetical protein
MTPEVVELPRAYPSDFIDELRVDGDAVPQEAPRHIAPPAVGQAGTFGSSDNLRHFRETGNRVLAESRGRDGDRQSSGARRSLSSKKFVCS